MIECFQSYFLCYFWNQKWQQHHTPSHSRSLPLVMNSSESVSSGVSMSSTLMSRSSGVSRKSSDNKEPSLWSKDRLISGAINVRRFLWDDGTPPPPPGGLTFRELGGAEEQQRWVRICNSSFLVVHCLSYLQALSSVRPQEGSMSPYSGSGLEGDMQTARNQYCWTKQVCCKFKTTNYSLTINSEIRMMLWCCGFCHWSG